MAKTDKEINEIFAKIDSQPSEELTQEEKESLAMAEAMDDGSSVSLEELKKDLEDYSGHIIVRMPKSLHKKLKIAASLEGVSLNQYIVYKLA